MKTKEEKKLLKARTNRQKKQAPPPSSQNTLRYEYMYESGLADVGDKIYSRTLKLKDVNYQIAPRSEQMNIFSRYGEILNMLAPTSHLELTIMNKKIDLDEFKKNMFYQDEEDHFDNFRHELNQIMEQKVSEGQSNFDKEKYLTIATQAQSKNEAKIALHRLENDLASGFIEIGAQTKEMNGRDRLEVIHKILRPNELFNFSYRDLRYNLLSTKSVIAPSSFNFRPRNAKLAKKAFEIGDEFGQVLFIRDFPTELGDRLISELMDIPSETTISLHIQPRDLAQVLSKLKNKRSMMESKVAKEQVHATNHGYSPELISSELKRNVEEIDGVIDGIETDSQKRFNCVFLIYVHEASVEKLQETIKKILSTGRKNGVNISNLDFMQEEAINSILPLGRNFVDVERGMSTTEIAIMTPFTAQDLTQKGGKFYGVNDLTNNIILIDRKKLNTPSGFILGSSGSGKGMSTKHEIISTRLKNPHDEVIILDPEDEYSFIGERFGAQIIRVAPDTSTFLNLLDLPDDLSYAEDDPVAMKASDLTDLMGVLIGGKNGLSAKQDTIIDRVTTMTYECCSNKTPTLKDWFTILKEQPEEDAKDLALGLELYINGSLDIFAHETNVELNNRFIIYNTKHLTKKLKNFGLMVVFDQIWNRVASNQKKGITTWLYFDEMQLLLSNPYASNFFFELWSRVRKYGAIPTGITQNVETLLLNENGRRMLSNTEFIIMLKQAKADRDELIQLLNISASQERFFINPKKGAGLIRAGSSIVPFSNTIPTTTELYKIMSTDPKNMVARS